MIAPVKLLGESYCLLHDFYPAKDYLEKHKLLLEMSKMALYTIQYHYNDIIFNEINFSENFELQYFLHPSYLKFLNPK